jgi:outer membrane protein assembly factor BamB
MFHRLGLRCLLVALALLAPVLVVGTQAVPAQAATAAIKIKPSSGPPTTKVSVSGTGFGGSEAVVVDFSATKVATATTSTTGAFSTSFKVPASATPGNYPVTATGQTSGDTATAPFLVRTNWAMLRFSAAGTGYNPYENVVNATNVGNLVQAWSEPSSQLSFEPASPPAEYNGVLYAGFGLGELQAYNPATGAVLWRGASIGSSGSAHTPAVANNVAYIASSDGNFYAYTTKTASASCSGTAPKTCQPLWTAAIGGAGSNDQSAAVVSGGLVYVAAGYNLYAFKAGGCGAATCNPVWVSAGSALDGMSTPAVSGGAIYVEGVSGLYAYSATVSSANCSGTAPATCTPLWIGNAQPDTALHDTAPAVAGGVAYLSNSFGLYAFSAGGCSSANCNPLWSFSKTGLSSPAVANGKVYVNASNGTLNVFSASDGTPLWTAPAPGAGTGFPAAATVANGVVYAGNRAVLEGSSADGTTGCSGSPKVCSPLWIVSGPFGSYWVTPIVTDGSLYTTNKNGTPFAAYRLP